MSQEELLGQIEALINLVHIAPETRYHICHWEGCFSFLPASHTAQNHTVFLIARGKTFIEGLTNHQWDNLLRKLTVFTEGLGQC